MLEYNGESVKINRIKKPPVGLMPKYIWDEQRHEEVKDAIRRYLSEDCQIPTEWIEEYNSFLKK